MGRADEDMTIDLVFDNVTVSNSSSTNIEVAVQDGDVTLNMTDVEASFSVSGLGIIIVKFGRAGLGSVEATLDRVTANGNDEDGLEARGVAGVSSIMISNSEFCGNGLIDLRNSFDTASTDMVTCDDIGGINTAGLSCISCPTMAPSLSSGPSFSQSPSESPSAAPS